MGLWAVAAVAWAAASAMAAGVSSSYAVLSPDAATVFVANPDSGTISAVNTERLEVVSELRVAREPRCISFGPDGRYLYVTDEAAASLVVMDTWIPEVAGAIATGAEPYGVVADPRGARVYVAATAMDRVEVYSAYPRLERLGEIRTRARPKGLAISADGTRLYATHLFTAEVSVIDTAATRVLEVIPTLPDGNFSQKIAIHPANGRAYLPMIRSNTSSRFLLFDGTVFPLVSVIDLATRQHVPRERIDLSLGPLSTNLPFDLAFSNDGARAYVAAFGSGDLSVVDLRAGQRVARVDVGDGPTAVVLSRDGRRAFVVNSLSEDLSVVDLEALAEVRRVRVTDGPMPAEVKRGKLLFFSSQSPAVSRERWMSCGSCHFFGQHDSRTWFTTLGIRNTTSMRGAGETRPLHWSGDRDEPQDFEHTVRDLQAGSGLLRDGAPHPTLGPSNAGLSADLDALAAFVDSLQAKPSPFRADTEAIERGRRIFLSDQTGCARCHVPPLYNSPGVRHDIGTGDGPDEPLGPAFDAPSLRMLWDSAPYLHDGSAATLRDVFTTQNPRDQHGQTSHLGQSDLDDLIAFLLSL